MKPKKSGGKIRGVNPKCDRCGSQNTIKNGLKYRNISGRPEKFVDNSSHQYLVGYYKCKDCQSYFFGEAYKPYSVDTAAKCGHCKIGVAKHKSCKYTTFDGIEVQCYVCSNCNRIFTSNPTKHKFIKRQISLRQILDLRNQGLSYGQIAIIAGVSKQTIWRYLGREFLG